MMDTKTLYDDFWHSFLESFEWPSELIGSPEKLVHASEHKAKNYYDFDKRYGFGFRPTATIGLSKDRLGAELSTASKRGRSFVKEVRENAKAFHFPSNLLILTHLNKTDAKIETIWESANVACRDLWPSHHVWIRSCLELLSSTFQSEIAKRSNG